MVGRIDASDLNTKLSSKTNVWQFKQIGVSRRPQSSQHTLEIALEPESFQLASNQRQYRIPRETKFEDNRKGQEKQQQLPPKDEKDV